MLEKLHKESFESLLHEPFHVAVTGSAGFDLDLVEVTEHLHSARQESFSVFFHGPASSFIQQGMYRLCHEKLGEVDLFLVPVGRDGDGFQYEAVFNHLIPAS